MFAVVCIVGRYTSQVCIAVAVVLFMVGALALQFTVAAQQFSSIWVLLPTL